MIGTGTIVAVASAPGRGARAVVRVSGAETGEIVGGVCGVEFVRGVRRVRLEIDGLCVPGVVVMYPGRGSYTGEDSAEFFVVGAPGVVSGLMACLLGRDGVRVAGPGEFSARAYVNGRLTLEEAEGVASLIVAVDDVEAEAGRRLLSGETGEEARGWVERLAGLLALVEAGIDFTDQEDVVAITAGDLVAALVELRGKLAARVGGAAVEAPAEGALVVLAGKPNAGKTTLLNALLGRERGVVSGEAGSTRDVLVERMEVRGSVVRLADVAGFDEEAEGVAGVAQEGMRGALREAAVVVHCDPAGEFGAVLGEFDGRVIRVRTKCDLPGVFDSSALGVCAIDGHNVGALREAIADAAVGARDATPRRRRAMVGAIGAIDEAAGIVGDGEGAVLQMELVACALREGLDSLGELAGGVTADEVIGRVFAGFCVGK